MKIKSHNITLETLNNSDIDSLKKLGRVVGVSVNSRLREELIKDISAKLGL